MIESFKARMWLILGVLFVTLLWLSPNFITWGDQWYVPQKKLNYGLDIQGGLHIVMGVDIDAVVKEKTIRLVSTLDSALKEKSVGHSSVVAATNEQHDIIVEVPSATAAQGVVSYVEEFYTNTLQVIEETDQKVVLRYFDAYITDYRSKVIDQAIESIRNRIDEFGVAEPAITAQGGDRIVVQLPGMADAEKAKELINKTAKLDFMLVSNEVPADKLRGMIVEAEQAGGYSLATLTYTEYVKRLNADLQAKLPANTVVNFQKPKGVKEFKQGADPYLLRTDTGLGGDDLKDAAIGFNEYGTPEVSLSFNPVGTSKFADLTGENINKQMAIVLDRVVKTAPVIEGRIPNGNARITLGGQGQTRQELMDEAKFITMSLRAGALPASLQQLEERTVGPTLGADSIKQGQNAAMVAAVLVFIFMLVYYKSFGVIANLAVMFNLLITFAVLTSLGATLTLPGIAGIALTIGMAVDANVIIFERIKEELARGSALHLAIKEGFGRAFSSIFDSNITTAATCVILIYFGTGPVRGFAVTLIIGLAASMFTAVFVSRFLLDLMVGKMKMRLSI